MRLAVLLIAALTATAADHVIVYRETGRYGGWPANHGIWSWGDEILVGFSQTYYKQRTPDHHQVDADKPEKPRLARSLDGGRTWKIEAPAGLIPPEQGGRQPVALEHPMDFSQPGFAMTLRFKDTNQGASRMWFSTDKGHTWNGPFEFPLFGFTGVAARTDYLTRGKHEALVFLTAAKSNGREGRPFCARTTDGGLTWERLGFIGEEPKGFAIMPSTVRLSGDQLLTTVRVKGESGNWIDGYRSADGGRTWGSPERITETGTFSGNPPSLIRLRDGRLCLTYGFRSKPFGIFAKISKDSGRTWSAPITLRDDGAAWDLGYVRSVERPDGKVVTVYYYNDAPSSERFIAATLWDPAATVWDPAAERKN